MSTVFGAGDPPPPDIGTGYYQPPPVPQGWQCPVCGRVYSPAQLTCPHSNEHAAAYLKIQLELEALAPQERGGGAVSAHPDWLRDLLSQLREFWPLDRLFRVVLQDDGFWTHHGYPDSTDGLCQIQPDLITIHIRDTAGDTEHWRGVVIHEYAHAILAPLTESADQTPEYVSAVEAHVWRLGGLIDFTLLKEAAE